MVEKIMMESACDYYEDYYDNRFWGLNRFCINFCKQTFANYNTTVKFVVSCSMGIIEVLEFLATMQLIDLLKVEQVNFSTDVTIYSYLGMMVVKMILLCWLTLGSWNTTQIGTCQKIV